MPLRPHINTREEFIAAVKEGYAVALDRLEHVVAPPGPKLLGEVHDLIFGKVLQPGWKFRDNTRPIETPKGEELCPHNQIKERLQTIAGECDRLPEKGNSEKAKLIAHFNANLMELQPFKDDLKTPWVNRTVASVVLEAQLEHCFRSELINRKIDAKKYEEALHWNNEFNSDSKMISVVKEMAGKGYRLHRLDDYRSKDPSPEHEH